MPAAYRRLPDGKNRKKCTNINSTDGVLTNLGPALAGFPRLDFSRLRHSLSANLTFMRPRITELSRFGLISWQVSGLCLGLCLAAVAWLAVGCASKKKGSHEGGFTRVFTPQPPPFIPGPMAVLLTNASGFSAHVTRQTDRFSEPEGVMSGDLICRGSKLLFAPDPNDPSTKRARLGSFIFIWDVAESRGYLLGEALQGYAPIASDVRPTNCVARPEAAASQKISGHAREPEETTVQTSDGRTTVLHVWRAAGLKGLPLRISTAAEASPQTITLSKIRLEVPPADLFVPPEEFTKYVNPQALVDEMALRNHNLKRAGTREPVPLEDRDEKAGRVQ
jgi:hypothetical protein